MTVNFSLPVKPFSVNKMSARDIRFKSAEYKDWATEVLQHLQVMDEYKSLMELAMAHKEVGGTFYVKFVYKYPPYVFKNKKGEISSKTIDCSNGAKPLLDLIFGNTLDVNDKYVTTLTEHKCAGPFYSVDVMIILNP